MNKRLLNNRGMTLIEVLATITITAILSTVIYSTFTTGLKLYQKIGIEGQLRDDADYIATMILNQLYDHKPNFVENYSNPDTGAKGIRLVRFKDHTVNQYIVEESKEIASEILIYELDNKFYIETLKGEGPPKVEITSETAENTELTSAELPNKSSISLRNPCTTKDENGNCSHGIIELNLVLKNASISDNSLLSIEPLILTSTFGF